MTADQVDFSSSTAQVASKPNEEKIRKIINFLFGPTKITVERDGERVKLFIPVEIVSGLEQANMKKTLGLEEEEKVLNKPGVRAFRV